MSSKRTSYARYRRRAEELARQAGAILHAGQNRRRTIDYKGTINLVTEMDRKVERLIGRELHRSFPDHDLLAEEEEKNVDTGSEWRWIVDPLDGTTNYAHALPIYSVSIGLEHCGKMVVGVVYQPALDEMFSAEVGKDARLNGRRIEPSRETKLERSLLVTGFPYDMHTTRKDNLDNFRKFMKSSQAVRRLGSAALDLCYVACGRFDGFWEMKLSPWDVAAGSLICAEAGVRITNLMGDEFSVYEGSVIASGRRIHRQMLTLLHR
jgi:myo-inositol-1(or 4)-monophosphatase